MSNPWYEVVGPDVRLTQGDIILECPLLKWQLDYAAEGESRASGEHMFKAAKGVKADVVVMTQGCDLEQGKVSDVVLCPCRPLSRYKPVWEEAERARIRKIRPIRLGLRSSKISKMATCGTCS